MPLDGRADIYSLARWRMNAELRKPYAAAPRSTPSFATSTRRCCPRSWSVSSRSSIARWLVTGRPIRVRSRRGRVPPQLARFARRERAGNPRRRVRHGFRARRHRDGDAGAQPGCTREQRQPAMGHVGDWGSPWSCWLARGSCSNRARPIPRRPPAAPATEPARTLATESGLVMPKPMPPARSIGPIETARAAPPPMLASQFTRWRPRRRSSKNLHHRHLKTTKIAIAPPSSHSGPAAHVARGQQRAFVLPQVLALIRTMRKRDGMRRPATAMRICGQRAGSPAREAGRAAASRGRSVDADNPRLAVEQRIAQSPIVRPRLRRRR